jgi:hypothetical protein
MTDAPAPRRHPLIDSAERYDAFRRVRNAHEVERAVSLAKEDARTNGRSHLRVLVSPECERQLRELLAKDGCFVFGEHSKQGHAICVFSAFPNEYLVAKERVVAKVEQDGASTDRSKIDVDLLDLQEVPEYVLKEMVDLALFGSNERSGAPARFDGRLRFPIKPNPIDLFPPIPPPPAFEPPPEEESKGTCVTC